MATILLSFCFINVNYVLAENFTSETRTLNGFSMTMTARTRKNSTIDRLEQTATNSVGDSITYLVFDWSQLESLQFTFSATLDGSVSYQKYDFSVSYIRAETLYPSFSTADKTDETLASGDVGAFPQFNFYYYIDSTSSATLGTNTARGYDFGLYKFDFSYSYLDDDKISHSILVGEIYVAVMPDDINSIEIPVDLNVTYSVSSSNALLNVYNLSVSTSLFTYCNPDYFIWEVTGTDQNNYHYCLDNQMQQQLEYNNYLAIWPSDIDNTGTNFVFDSNNIEGTWTVKLTIVNSDGETLATCYVDGLSTIKAQQTSYLWLIILIVLLIIFLIAVILTTILIIHKKKEKVW